MYGRYTKDLGEYAKDEARRLKQLERQRKKDDRARDKVNDQNRFAIFSLAINIEYKATVVGIYRNYSETVAEGNYFEQYPGAGDIHLREWEKIGYS